MLTQQRLKEVLNYDSETGIFTWKTHIQKNHIDKEAGWNKDGYICIDIDEKKYRAHRLAWLYVYGNFPKNLDHINGIRNDNRIENLRECSQSQNAANQCIRKDNQLKIKGVSFSKDCKRKKPFMARLIKNGKYVYRKRFATREEAKAAYDAAAVEHFGEFARFK